MATRVQYEAARGILAVLDSATDAGGILQADDALRIMPHSRPDWHCVQTYGQAAHRLGLEQDADGEWYVADTIAAADAMAD